ncbi:hypothetical protein ASE01_07925 [Nocardioides sp. Root190]|uniref:glycoside hydrolase family 16 protein n=1 Tax=Nocardioides sp. Root190 TaxID=1736488 RepID=UPI0007005F0E|nr:glycoside hydrolase family 16 protein [Nocardioides sp. Root190]KRB78080.1 hypothetical protein ASE01_07925 [Nocardioides sp. Root190]
MRSRLLLAALASLLLLAAATTWWVVARDDEPAADGRCGPELKKPGGGTWECTFADDFSGSRLDPDTWLVQELVGSDDMCATDSARTIAVSDGHLQLSVVKTDPTTDPTTVCPVRPDGTRATYAAGWISTHGRWSQQYGRFEARIRVQDVPSAGVHEAFWLWPDVRYGADKPWPASGEIDIMETYSQHPDLVVPFLHYGADDNGGPVDGLNTAQSCRTTRGEWHDYALEWTAEELRILVDGKTCLVNTAGASSFRKRFIINFTQFLGSGQNTYQPTMALPVSMEVDHVRAWR